MPKLSFGLLRTFGLSDYQILLAFTSFSYLCASFQQTIIALETLELTTTETAKDLGLLPEEFERIKEILGRVPNFTELSIFSVMWSEHCSYKNSITWLKTLPKDGPRMLAKAG